MYKRLNTWKGLALILAIVLLISGCGASEGNKSNNGSNETSSGNVNDPVTIRFAWWGSDPRHQATLEAINKYTELYPNVKIEAEYMGFDGYSKKLATQFAGSTAPDIFQYVNSFNDQLGDFLLDLNTTALDTSTYPESALKDYATYKDKLIFIPTGQNVLGTLYNEAFFDKFGIPKDTVWNWDNLIEIGKKVHEQDNKSYLLTADIDVIEKLIIIPYITQKTGESWIEDDFTPNFTEQDLEDAYSYLMKLYENNVLEPFGNSSAFVGKMEQNPKWVNGEIGMLFDYVGTYDKYAQSVSDVKVSIGPFPEHLESKHSANPLSAGLGFAINETSKVSKQAVEFLNWLVNDGEAAKILNTQRGIPASSIALESLSSSNLLNPEIKAAIDYAATRNSLPLTVLSDNANLRTVHEDVIQKIIYGKQDIQNGALEAMEAIKDKLEEIKADTN